MSKSQHRGQDTQTQGAKATRNGKTLENAIRSALQSKGFEVVSHAAHAKHPERYGSEVLLTGAPYVSLYGSKCRSEFLLSSKEQGLNVRIECCWQATRGSVDEKLPYLFLNCVERMPEADVIVVVDGGGAKEKALAWLRRAAMSAPYARANHPEKRVRIFSMVEFFHWLNEGVDRVGESVAVAA